MNALNSIDEAKSIATPTPQAKAQAALATGIYPDAILRGAAGHGGGGGPTSPSSTPTPAPSLPTGPNGITPSLPGANVSSTPSGQYHSTSHYASIGSGGMVTGGKIRKPCSMACDPEEYDAVTSKMNVHERGLTC